MRRGMLLLLYILAGLVLVVFSTLYFLQEKMIFFPEQVPASYRYPFTQPFKEVFITSPDGARLHALHFRAPGSRGVILYFHGNAGSLRSWGYVAADLVAYHYDVLMVDYRGFGKSTGQLSEAALHRDAQQFYDWLRQQYPENRIVVFGRSLGTGVATRLAGANQPRALVLESPFYNFRDVARTHYPFLPVALLLKYHFRSDQFLPQVRCPAFILHGTADEIVPFASGRKLAQLLPANGRFFAIEGGGHNDLEAYPAYRQALRSILNSPAQTGHRGPF